jgi:alkylglycerol monooxygenase
MNNSTNQSVGVQELLSSPVATGLRSLFYLLTPSETSYAKLEDVPKFVDKAPPFFFALVLLEIIILNLQNQRSRLPRQNDMFSSLSAGVISLLPLLVMRNIEIASYVWVYDNYRLYEMPYNSPWTWVLSMLGVDLGYYWVHRFAHEINFMWAGHQTHHSSEDYTLTTALRQGVFQKYSSWIFYLPMALFIPPSVFAVHIQFNLLYQFWIHTNAINKIGPLEYILNTPSHHRVHHGVNRYCIDKNYAGVLIIWDRMFGTFEPEQDRDDIVYGLVHQVQSWNPVYVQTNHWLYLLKTVYETHGIGNKLSVLLKGPGWQPGKPRLGLREDIPDVHAPAVKYDKKVSRRLSIFCLIMFLESSLLVEIGQRYLNELPLSVRWLIVLYVLWSFTNIGFTFESRSLAPYSLLIQWIVYLVADAYLCAGSYGIDGKACPGAMKYLQIAASINVAVILVWIVKLHRKQD